MIVPFLFLMAGVNFEDKIAPVLIERCLPCHSSIKVIGRGALDYECLGVASRDSGRAREESSLY